MVIDKLGSAELLTSNHQDVIDAGCIECEFNYFIFVRIIIFNIIPKHLAMFMSTMMKNAIKEPYPSQAGSPGSKSPSSGTE